MQFDNTSRGFVVIVPARYASTRLPGKPLADIAGIPMVVRTAQRAAAAVGVKRVVVATDSDAVQTACRKYSVESIGTRLDHLSGSDRIAEACDLLKVADDEIVVNVQGDEPLIDPALISSVALMLEQNPYASISTAAHPILNKEEYLDPNTVKVVLDSSNKALYFSRAPIPFFKTTNPNIKDIGYYPSLQHIGIYAYRKEFVQNFTNLAVAPSELYESLEQLRALWHGYSIVVHVTKSYLGFGVDSPVDLKRVKMLFSSGNEKK